MYVWDSAYAKFTKERSLLSLPTHYLSKHIHASFSNKVPHLKNHRTGKIKYQSIDSNVNVAMLYTYIGSYFV